MAPDKDGKRWSEVVATFNACKFPGLPEVFKQKTDCFIYADDGNTRNGSMTNDIETIRHYIMTKPHTRPLTWTNRDKPDWWEV